MFEEYQSPKIHYVNNKELYLVFKSYHPLLQEATKAGIPRPEIPEIISHAILQIARKLSNSHNFVSYSYKQEMISDGILKSFAKFHLFDPSKSDNPFSYITQICFNSFINRIKTEKKQTSIRARLISDKLSSDFVAKLENEDKEVSNAFVDFLKDNEIFTDSFEEQKSAPKTGYNNPMFKHRNKTAYIKKEKVVKESLENNLYELAAA